MSDFKFGDIICYRGAAAHDDPLMYVGECAHDVYRRGTARLGGSLIDILDISGKYTEDLEHKAPQNWQHCTHVEPDVQVR